MRSILKWGFIFLCFAMLGCKLAYRTLLGVDTSPGWMLKKEIIKNSNKLKIPTKRNLFLDTATFYNNLKAVYEEAFKELNQADSIGLDFLKLAAKDDAQPVQFRLFTNSGNEIFKIVNCYVDPPIPMNWNIDGAFDTFPPKIDFPSLNTHFLDLDFFLKLAANADGKRLSLNDFKNVDYVGMVFWNDFMIRPSRKLIKLVRQKVVDWDASIELVFVNNHNAVLWQLANGEEKQKFKEWLEEKEG